MRRSHAPQLGPGWGPMMTPPPQRPRFPRVRHELILLGALFCVAMVCGLLRSRAGLLAVALAWVLRGFLANHRLEGRRRWWRAVVEYSAVAALVLALTAAAPGGPKVRVAVDRKPPAERIEQTKGDLDKARQGFADLLDQLKGRLPDPPQLQTEKGDR